MFTRRTLYPRLYSGFKLKSASNLKLGLVLTALLLLLTCLDLASPKLEASSLGQASPSRFTSWFSNSNKTEFLRPEHAFKASAWVKGSQVFVNWDIEPGYYLYQDKTRLELEPNTGLVLAAPDFPPALTQEDEYFGVTQVYYQQLYLSANLSSTVTTEALPKKIALDLHYQGCADAGLCYPPQKQTLEINLAQLDISAPPLTSSLTSTSSLTTAAPPTTTGTQLTQLLGSGQLWLTLGLFFLAGLGLTFTPCVLPMLPILSTIIIGKGTQPAVAQPKMRGLLLSSAYVAGMALTYALIGAAMGFFGASLNLTAAMQSPWLLVPVALLFLALALSLFGAWELRLPAWLDQRLQNLQQPKKSTLFNVAIMGSLSTLIVSPCLTAPLAGALAFIATSGSTGTGSLALFMLGLGMGVPLIITGTFGAHWLPKAGAWMQQVKILFGWLMLLMAAWLLARLLPASISMLMWGGLALTAGVFIGGLKFNASTGWAKLRLAAGLALLIYAASLLVGGLAGQSNPLQPLQGLTATSNPTQTQLKVPLLSDLNALEEIIASSSQPVLVDLYADWCISCKVMEARVFPRSDIQQAMQGITRVKLDLTTLTPETRHWLDSNQLFGPPTLMFFNQGQEWQAWRIQGEVNARQLLTHLTAWQQAVK